MTRRSDIPMPWRLTARDKADLAGIIVGAVLLGAVATLFIVGLVLTW